MAPKDPVQQMFLTRRMKTFIEEEKGAATVEAVLWFPVMFAMLCLAVDTSFIFFSQNQAYRVVQDANRNLSIGRLSNADDVSGYITTHLSGISPNADVASSVSAGMVTSVVKMPSSDLAVTGVLNSLMTTTITVGGRHFVEY